MFPLDDSVDDMESAIIDAQPPLYRRGSYRLARQVPETGASSHRMFWMMPPNGGDITQQGRTRVDFEHGFEINVSLHLAGFTPRQKWSAVYQEAVTITTAVLRLQTPDGVSIALVEEYAYEPEDDDLEDVTLILTVRARTREGQVPDQMSYGEMYLSAQDTLDVAQDVAEQIISANWADGLFSGFERNGSELIYTRSVVSRFDLDAHLSFSSSGVADVHLSIYKNDAVIASSVGHQKIANPNEADTQSTGALVELTKDDTIQLWIEADAARTLTFEHMHLAIKELLA